VPPGSSRKTDERDYFWGSSLTASTNTILRKVVLTHNIPLGNSLLAEF